ncbi:MAG TPA: hypothetical protein VHA52_10635 [Candidatus Babeliaceae bacterium]|nr:hypothetical protein [Candidatus Babeliaceae bacterium]
MKKLFLLYVVLGVTPSIVKSMDNPHANMDRLWNFYALKAPVNNRANSLAIELFRAALYYSVTNKQSLANSYNIYTSNISHEVNILQNAQISVAGLCGLMPGATPLERFNRTINQTYEAYEYYRLQVVPDLESEKFDYALTNFDSLISILNQDKDIPGEKLAKKFVKILNNFFK